MGVVLSVFWGVCVEGDGFVISQKVGFICDLRHFLFVIYFNPCPQAFLPDV
jgi:hypothetical protein